MRRAVDVLALGDLDRQVEAGAGRAVDDAIDRVVQRRVVVNRHAEMRTRHVAADGVDAIGISRGHAGDECQMPLSEGRVVGGSNERREPHLLVRAEELAKNLPSDESRSAGDQRICHGRVLNGCTRGRGAPTREPDGRSRA